MKKVYSFIEIAMFGLLVTVMMTSCKKDSTSAFNASPRFDVNEQQAEKNAQEKSYSSTAKFGYKATPKAITSRPHQSGQY